MRIRLTLAFLFLCATFAGAQTTVAPLTNPHVQFFNNSAPCAGCLLDTFAAGTTNALVTYSESTGTTPNSNPVVLGSDGSAVVYLTSASYKLRLRTAAGVQIWTQDGVSWLTPLTTFPQGSVAGNFDITQPIAAINGANQSSFNNCIHGTFFNVASLDDKWCFQNVIGTGTSPTSTLTLTHSGSSGAATFSIPGNVSVGGAVKLTETSAPTCALGTDFIWGDSVAHREKVCDNNGSLVQLIHSGADINTTDQVTVTHLAAALPVLQGGTGVTTAQGNGTKVQLASGGTTTGNFLNYDANGNAIDSGKIAPSGTVVGTTDTQALSGKTLTAPIITGTAPFNRFRANQGTALVTGDVGSLSAWGAGASASAVSGTDAAMKISITAGSSGFGANPAFTVTFHDGTWTAAPICQVTRGDVNSAGHAAATSTATTVQVTTNTTPSVPGQVFVFYITCTGI